ncbi:hypothetical protein ABI59_07670 [Acidobacteria bacterium Mor1]|nr:hypothetical protein ABI59_07670 [Acidobacteria bacterium Mor1]
MSPDSPVSTRPRFPARVLLVVLALAALVGCSDPAEDPDPAESRAPEEAAALALFEMAELLDADEEKLRNTVREDLIESDRTALLDAIARLRGESPPRIQGVEPMIPDDRQMITLEADLPDEGLAVFRVLAERDAEDHWKVVWFSGPGIEWPAPRIRGEGLSSSSQSR